LKAEVGINSAVIGFRFDSSVPLEIGDTVSCNVKGTRSHTTILFSVFIALSMWILSLTTFILAFTLCYRQRKVEPPTIAVACALLFALPAIRNIQPGAPTIGVTIDTVGFMWNMILVLSACVMLMWNYILKYKKDPTERYEERDDREMGTGTRTTSSRPLSSVFFKSER
jgi:hypothetical protein